MTRLLQLAFFLLMGLTISAQSNILITEISYNPPESGVDSLEYLELHNPTSAPISLQDWSFTMGIEYDSLDFTIEPGEYVIIAGNAIAVSQTLSVPVIGEWTRGGLNNSGEQIQLVDNTGAAVVDITYDDRNGWPGTAQGTDGGGASIELCDLAADPAIGFNWQASSTSTGVSVGGIEFLGTPGAANNCEDIGNPTADLVVSELLYNDPTMDDDLEFMEIYNNGEVAVDLTGFRFTEGVEYTFNGEMIEPGGFLVVAREAAAADALGFPVTAWTSGSLSNSGSTITLVDDSDEVVFSFTYGDDAPWPTNADGGGVSLSLCNTSGDINDAGFWRETRQDDEFAIDYNGSTIYVSPGRLMPCVLTIGEATTNDSVGLSTYLDQEVILSGVVHSGNYRSGGLEFAIQDDQGEGIVVFSGGGLSYSPELGDQLTILGRITHFSGLTEIIPNEIIVDGSGSLMDPRIVTTLDNSTEGELVTIEDVTLLDPNEWSGAGSGFDVEVTNGANTFVMRIDRDIDLFSLAPPVGTFDVTGIGWQFDPVAPFLEGFTLQPRDAFDIDPYSRPTVTYPSYDIAAVTTVNADGELDSAGVRVTLQAVVHGPNFRPSGQSFPIIDASNDGVRVVNLDETLGVEVAIGDEVEVKGTMNQFRGLTQVVADSIRIVSPGNALVDPLVVTVPSEDVESSLIEIRDPLTWVDETQWRGDGSSFSIDVTNGLDTFEIFIDNDNELADQSIPLSGQSFAAIGIGNQFDGDFPFVDNYQLLVRSGADFIPINSTNDPTLAATVQVFPNPVQDYLQIRADTPIQGVAIYSADGRLMLQPASADFSVTDLPAGLYVARVRLSEGEVPKVFLKQ